MTKTTMTMWLAAAAAASLLGCGSSPQELPYTEVQFQVTNNSTFRPPGYGMSIVGDHPALGDNVAASGLRLRLQPDGTFVGAAWLPVGRTITYHAQMVGPSAAALDAMDRPADRTVLPSADTPPEVFEVVKWSAPTDVIQPCITFVVTVPANTPSGDSVYIAGDDQLLGPWNPGKAKLTKQADGTHKAQLCFDQGKLLPYKYTRGDWNRVEKAEDGSELANRTLLITENQTRTDTVVKWADL